MAGGQYTLTRKQVAERRGISVSSVRRLEFVKLRPMYDGHGVWRFDPAEVDALVLSAKGKAPRQDPRRKQRRDGRVAAKVFSLFERGADLTRIVVALRLPPRTVRALYRDWQAGLEGERPKAAKSDKELPKASERQR